VIRNKDHDENLIGFCFANKHTRTKFLHNGPPDRNDVICPSVAFRDLSTTESQLSLFENRSKSDTLDSQQESGYMSERQRQISGLTRKLSLAGIIEAATAVESHQEASKVNLPWLTNLVPGKGVSTQKIANVAGEESGVLDSMLEKSATYYEELVVFDSLTALIEPFIITFLGVVVGSMMVAMYLPIFQMGGAIIG
jgi:uncharacterized membrane protein YgaE (UPF0421/DUF939 family)